MESVDPRRKTRVRWLIHTDDVVAYDHEGEAALVNAIRCGETINSASERPNALSPTHQMYGSERKKRVPPTVFDAYSAAKWAAWLRKSIQERSRKLLEQKNQQRREEIEAVKKERQLVKEIAFPAVEMPPAVVDFIPSPMQVNKYLQVLHRTQFDRSMMASKAVFAYVKVHKYQLLVFTEFDWMLNFFSTCEEQTAASWALRWEVMHGNIPATLPD